MRRRGRGWLVATVVAVAAMVSACTSAGSDAVTMTSTTTLARPPSSGSSTGSASAAAVDASTAPTSSPPGSASAIRSTASGAGPSSSGGPISGSNLPVVAPGSQPDGFLPTKLAPGHKPPQFIVVSFDGAGWHEKWSYWKAIQDKVPFNFTAFLSGTYLLSDQTKTHYQGPGKKPGKSDIGWNTPADLPVQIADLNDALRRGDEIGSHCNGHFCTSVDGSGGGKDWNIDDWNEELDQFFGLLKNVNANNGISDKLNLAATEIRGERTPCLEGRLDDLFPALAAHGMTYDSSFTRRGISWPTKNAKYGIWQIGMAQFPMHGTLSNASPVDPSKRTNHFQITMDYNFWFSQNGATKGSPQESAADSAQVKATYDDMFAATFNGNRAPLILGNHFNAWNNDAYSDAIGKFVQEKCGQPDVKCVPFRDLIAWMNLQDPATLHRLQQQAPELAARS